MRTTGNESVIIDRLRRATGVKGRPKKEPHDLVGLSIMAWYVERLIDGIQYVESQDDSKQKEDLLRFLRFLLDTSKDAANSETNK